jgi:hypothetical protein
VDQVPVYGVGYVAGGSPRPCGPAISRQEGGTAADALTVQPLIASVRVVTQPSSEFVVYGQDAASYLGLTGVAHGVLADLDAAYLHPFAAAELPELQASLLHIDALHELHQLFTLHHGNWCGPGHLGTAEVDVMDSYCHVHDNTYDALGVTSGGAGANPGVSMWSRAGFQATVEADEALVQSVSQLTGLDGDADWYRDNIIRIFSSRAHIGRLLRRLPF